ncbi:hypothetical protein BaRGS_00018395 [Batillaria attramentaria]|uniref:Uncharacterized protein n=1 Tax=Batillaria attramentaria TaxID=370345 RepID=A0ABD0KTR8_9CAEN
MKSSGVQPASRRLNGLEVHACACQSWESRLKLRVVSQLPDTFTVTPSLVSCIDPRALTSPLPFFLLPFSGELLRLLTLSSLHHLTLTTMPVPLTLSSYGALVLSLRFLIRSKMPPLSIIIRDFKSCLLRCQRATGTKSSFLSHRSLSFARSLLHAERRGAAYG